MIAIANDAAKPSAVSFRIRPRRRCDVDLEAREEQQEGQADERQDRDGEVGLDPAESGRTDHDAEHDLEHDRGEPEARGRIRAPAARPDPAATTISRLVK